LRTLAEELPSSEKHYAFPIGRLEIAKKCQSMKKNGTAVTIPFGKV